MAESVSIYSLLENHTRRDPALEAAVFDGQSMSYGDLLDRVTTAAGWLMHNGLVPGEVAGIAISDEIEHLIVAMALACLATPQVNLPSQETGAAKRAIAEKIGCRQVIAERPADWMAGMRVLVPPHELVPVTVGRAPVDATPFSARFGEAPVIFQKSSGTTSVPRIFGRSLDRLLAIAERQSTPNEARVLRTSSMEFDASRLYRICALMAGNTCVFSSRLDLGGIGDVCHAARVSELHIGTYKLASLMRSRAGPIRPLPPTTRVMTGGSRVSGALRRNIRGRLTTNLWVSYATSEVGPISLAGPEQHEAFPEGVGRPLPGVDVEIVDEDDNPVPPGAIGRARIRKYGSPGAYVDDPGASTSFRGGWFRPGDLLSRDEAGPLIFHGRVDDLMILNGININPTAIEDVLESHPDVAEAIAFPIKSRIHGEIPVAAVVLSEMADTRLQRKLTDHCRATLGVRGPRQVYIIDRIPRNDAGKPLRHLAAEIVDR